MLYARLYSKLNFKVIDFITYEWKAYYTIWSEKYPILSCGTEQDDFSNTCILLYKLKSGMFFFFNLNWFIIIKKWATSRWWRRWVILIERAIKSYLHRHFVQMRLRYFKFLWLHCASGHNLFGNYGLSGVLTT